jgi:formylglycine-generating enzyme required for sulfatase activity
LLLGTLHKDRRAPLVYLHALAVFVVAAFSLWPRSSKAAEDWRPTWISMSPRDVCLAKQELTQEQWRVVWDAAPARSREFGLPREPSVFVGDDRPVETVSFCEAIRFCNLWSLSEGLTPYYCEAPAAWGRSSDTSNACAGVTARSFRVEQCEQNGGIAVSPSANGYRLAPYGLVLSVWSQQVEHDRRLGLSPRNAVHLGWFTASAGFQTHSAGTFEGGSLAFDDIFGNVSEWSDRGYSRSGSMSAHGGSWFGMGYTRVAAAAPAVVSFHRLNMRGLPRTFRSGLTGLRLAASPGAQGCARDADRGAIH